MDRCPDEIQVSVGSAPSPKKREAGRPLLWELRASPARGNAYREIQQSDEKLDIRPEKPLPAVIPAG